MKNIVIIAGIVAAALLVFIVGSAWFVKEPVVPPQTVTPTGILEGQMALLYGNCHKKQPENMDLSNLTECNTRPLSATLLVTKPSLVYQQDRLITAVNTEEDGNFRVRLPQGEYSLWILQNEEISCGFVNPFSEFCAYTKINPGQTTRRSVLLNKAAFITP